MAYQHKDNSGSLFKNTKREKDTHPNATGSCLIEGVEYRVSAWTKTGDKGPWQSLAFKRKEEKQEKPGGYQNPAEKMPERMSPKELSGSLDEDIPF